MEEEMEICSNCKREIPSVNYVIHTVHCHRNIAVCGICTEPVPRNELAEHQAREHKDVSCECGELMETSCLRKHKAEQCRLRVVACTFCELELSCRDLGDHENYCGSRTEKCEECGEFVMLKYKALHVDSNHGFIKLEDEPGPAPSWAPAASITPRPITSVLKSHPSPTCVTRPLCTPSNVAPKAVNSVRFADELHVKRENQAQRHQGVNAAAKCGDTEAGDRLLALRLAHEDMQVLSEQLRPQNAEAATPSNVATQDEEVELPCEFCDCLVPASRLVLHQTGCRPDLARYENTRRNDTLLRNDVARGDTIPCDLCGTCMPASTFLQHQLACEIRRLPGKPSDRPQALVMPLSGRSLKARAPLNYVIPEAKNLWNTDQEDKSVHKPALPQSSSSSSQAEAPGNVPAAKSNGAVPKRKAGNYTFNQGQVQQEVPRPPAPSVEPSTRRRAPPIRPIEYKRNDI